MSCGAGEAKRMPQACGGEVMGKESVVDSKGFFCLGFHTWFGRLMQPKKVSREESPGTSQKV